MAKLEQFLDGGVVGHGEDVAGEAVDEAQFAQVEEVVQNGGRQVFRSIGTGRGEGRDMVGFPDHLTDFQSTARHQETGQVAVVVAPAVFVELGGASHFPGHDEEDVLIESAVMQILDESGHRMVDLAAHRVEPGHALGAVVVGVVIPSAIRNGDEGTARLAEPAGHEHLQAEQVGDAAHVAPALKFAGVEERAGVVLGESLGVFLCYVESGGDPLGHDVESLLTKVIGSFERAVRIKVAFDSVESSEQALAVGQAVGGDAQLHVFLGGASAGRVEGGVGRPEGARVGEAGEGPGFEIAPELEVLVDGLGQDQTVVGHARFLVEGTPDPGGHRARGGLHRIAAAGDFQIGVARVSRLVGTNDGQLVRHLGQLGKGGTESEPRNGGGDFPVDATVFRRGGHFGIEEFDVWGAALQEEKDDRLVSHGFALGHGLGLGFKQAGEGQVAQSETKSAEGARLEKVTTAQALAGLIRLMVG